MLATGGEGGTKELIVMVVSSEGSVHPLLSDAVSVYVVVPETVASGFRIEADDKPAEGVHAKLRSGIMLIT